MKRRTAYSDTHRPRLTYAAVCLALAVPALVGLSAAAAYGVTATPTAPPATSTTAPGTKPGAASKPLSPQGSAAGTVVTGYDMGITESTYAQSGCMVCHGDRALVRLVNGKLKSYWIDPERMVGSGHVKVLCTGCHTDFAFKAPHATNGKDWRIEAKTACKSCHQPEYDQFRNSVHAAPTGPASQSDAKNAPKRRPLCGDCHIPHQIEMLTNNPAARARLHGQGDVMCGSCHAEANSSYNDYYHGAAYRRGAKDAPACWQCHDAHEVRKASDRRSSVNASNIEATCGQCHKGVDEGYTRYAVFIHGRAAAYKENPVYAIYLRARAGLTATVTGIIGTVRSWFGST